MAQDNKIASKVAFDHQAPVYDTTYYGKHARSSHQYLIDRVCRTPFQSVLDIGCGTGSVLKGILDFKGDSIKAYGLDISKQMLVRARMKLHDRAILVEGDSEYLPFESGTMDCVICCDSFHHYPSPTQALSEMHRVLVKDGTLFLCDCWYPKVVRAIVNFSIRFAKSGDVKMYSRYDMANLLAKAGFKAIGWDVVNTRSFLVNGKKI